MAHEPKPTSGGTKAAGERLLTTLLDFGLLHRDSAVMPGRRGLALLLGAMILLAAGGCSSQPNPATTGPATTTGPSETPSTPSPKPGTWRTLPTAPIPGNFQQAAAWDGSELLIAERVTSPVVFCRDTAAAYRPQGDEWRKLPPPPGPKDCFEGGDVAEWSGKEMLLWGVTNTAYNPDTNHWRHLPESPAGQGGPAVAVWTGSQMIGWGGGCCGDASADGAAYTPATNSWERLPSAPIGARSTAAGAWTGTEMIVAGGTTAEVPEFHILADAAAYNPRTHTWRKLPPMPAARAAAIAVWDGGELLVIGGRTIVGDRVKYLARGVAYNPSTNRWRWLPPMAFPREGFVAEWTGSQVLVWGGRSRPDATWLIPPNGEAYDPTTNAWSSLPRSPLRGRADPVAAWTGSAMIIWGGFTEGRYFDDGAVFTPGTS